MPLQHKYWWVKDRTWKRQHLLDLRDEGNNYSAGYCDIREKVLLANFKLLRTFVEQEIQRIDWDDTAEYQKVRAEIDALYHWWTVERPGKITDFIYDANWEAQEEEMLLRLIKVRAYLWTYVWTKTHFATGP